MFLGMLLDNVMIMSRLLKNERQTINNKIFSKYVTYSTPVQIRKQETLPLVYVNYVLEKKS